MWTFVGKVMYLLFNMRSRFDTFLLRSKHLLILCLPSPSTVILEPTKMKSVAVFAFPHLFAMNWWNQMPWSSSWMLSFKPAFSLSSLSFIKRLFSSSLLSAIRVVSSTYLRLLIFLPEILIRAWASSSWAFHMLYSAYKLNKQGDNIQSLCTPFPIWNQSTVPCSVLTIASGPAYRFLKRQVRWSGIPISVSFPQFVVIHTVKGFCMVNKAELGVFLEFSCFLYDLRMLAIWSLVPLPFLYLACTSGSSWFTHYGRLAWRVLSITLLACEMSTTVR